ncbi:MAG TPA: hypothetical protein VGC80_10850 [Acetobacteraceae bacterium]|jgi:hypothetical protein
MAHLPGTTQRTQVTGTPARGSAIWVQGLACGALVTLAAPTAMLGGVLLAPGLLLLLFDREPGRAQARIVLLSGGALAASPLATLWRTGHDWPVALDLLSDLSVPVACWAAQAVGWMVGQLAPLGVRFVMDMRTRAQASRMRADRARLEEEWNLPPAAD